MKVAIMQPYLFPYLGYYQLVSCADMFVLYDDVSFIKQGYINRNSILMNGRPTRMTIPVPGASSNKRIMELTFASDVSKVLKTVKQAYAKAPFYDDVFPLVERVLTNSDRDITTTCKQGILEVFDYLGISKRVVRSSALEFDRNLPAADRLMAICDRLGSSEYVNSIGGQKLYSKEYFGERGKSLSFLEMHDISYTQGVSEFVPYLSMIDVLMWCDKPTVRGLLQQYTLV